MPEFKFQIGDILCLRTALVECAANAAAGNRHYPVALQVIERRSQECPNGTQLHYAFSKGDQLALFNETELLPYSEFDSAGLAVVAAKAKGQLDKLRFAHED